MSNKKITCPECGSNDVFKNFESNKVYYHCANCNNNFIMRDPEPTPELKKPPLGLMPKDIFESNRVIDIGNAIYRYIEASKKIPLEWVEEYNKRVNSGGN